MGVGRDKQPRSKRRLGPSNRREAWPPLRHLLAGGEVRHRSVVRITRSDLRYASLPEEVMSAYDRGSLALGVEADGAWLETTRGSRSARSIGRQSRPSGHRPVESHFPDTPRSAPTQRRTLMPRGTLMSRTTLDRGVLQRPGVGWHALSPAKSLCAILTQESPHDAAARHVMRGADCDGGQRVAVLRAAWFAVDLIWPPSSGSSLSWIA